MLLEILRGKITDFNEPGAIVQIGRDFVDLELFGNQPNVRVLFEHFVKLGLSLNFF